MIEFIDDLPGGGSYQSWSSRKQLKDFASALEANPGRWAKYPTKISAKTAPTRASEIRNGRAAAFQAGTFESAVLDGVLYVRAVSS